LEELIACFLFIIFLSLLPSLIFKKMRDVGYKKGKTCLKAIRKESTFSNGGTNGDGFKFFA
jgi:hypothetical protein